MISYVDAAAQPKLRAAANATLQTTQPVDNRLRRQRAMQIVLMQRRGYCDAVPRFVWCIELQRVRSLKSLADARL